MAEGQAWEFLQLEGPPDSRKKLVLSGWNAPYGRPRKDPVVRETIKSRIHTTRYPGGNGQTRHAFGTNWEGFELKGRWMTKFNSDGATANTIADDWIQFLRDERTIRIAWGNIISWTGYLEELELARESENEIAWKMKFQIDIQDTLGRDVDFGATVATPDIDQSVAFLQSWVGTGIRQIDDIADDLAPDFLESLENLAAELNKPQALLNKLANKFDQTVERTFGVIKSMRGAVAGMRTATVQFRETILTTQIEAAMLVRTTKGDIAWANYVHSMDYESMFVAERLADLDRALEIQEKLEFTKLAIAREGDTWESIAIRTTGTPSKAAEIRSINGVRYGEKPTVGMSYLVP